MIHLIFFACCNCSTISLVINSIIHSLSQPFPPDIPNIINHKLEELGRWNVERMFTPHNVSKVTCRMSHVTCHVSCVMCHVSHFFLGGGQSCEAYRWRVCYQRGLSRLVYVRLDDWFLFSHQWKHFLEVMFKFLWRIILNFLNRVLKIGYHIFARSRQKEIFITECQSSREKRLSGAIIP